MVGNYMENFLGEVFEANVETIRSFVIGSLGMAQEFPLPKPIPLTEEWLIKFGFEKGFGEYNKGWFVIVELRGIFKLRSNDGNINAIKVNYVHELQNLYYTLTKNELTAKL